MNPRQGSLRFSSLVALAVLGYLGATPIAQAATPIELPAGATPGGALPMLDRDAIRPRDKAGEVPEPSQDKAPTVPESGVRMAVKAFVLQGVVDHPERGITLDDLEQRAEAIRTTRPQGFTISELQQVTDEITRIYRGAGYILARAYIPEQEVTDGRVVIRILEGIMEQLTFQGNQDYDSEVLAKPFAEVINQPVNREEIERSLLELSDYPGLGFTSVFSPGDVMGTAKLGINVEKEESFEGAVWLDNYGSAYTGEYRLWVDAAYNNPSGAADRLTAQVLTTMGDDEGKSNYYALGYERPVFGHRNIFGIDISNNAYTVGGDFAALDLKGKSSMINLSMRRKFIRSRLMNIEGRAVLSSKKSSSDLSYLNIGEDALTVLTLGGIIDYRNSSGGYTQTALHYSQGIPGVLGAMDEDGDGNSSRTGGSGDAAGGNFSKFNLQLAHWQPLTFSTLVQNQSILARIDAQSSSDLLVSMEQMSLGGPNSVRAYPSAEYMVDSGYFISLEWIARASSATKGKFFENLQFSAFYDYAAGELNDPLANDVESPDLQGFGASIQFAPEDEYFARLDLATPIGDPDPSNDRNLQYFFRFGYMF